MLYQLSYTPRASNRPLPADLAARKGRGGLGGRGAAAGVGFAQAAMS